jgi:argininosuccinate lyase
MSLDNHRLTRKAADALIRAFEAPQLERQLRHFSEYLSVDRAHVVALVEQGIIDRSRGAEILRHLTELSKQEVKQESFPPELGSILLQVEHKLANKLGEKTAGYLSVGRSRIDQMTTARRLYKRRGILDVANAITELQSVLIEQAYRYEATVMPGYTCLQHSHPWVFGHYLLSFADRLSDDFERMTEIYVRVNRSTLGAAGLSGTSWPLDRRRTMELLGFSDLVCNSRLAREAYYAAELVGGLSFVMCDLNDLATDLHIWSSYEFGLVETDDTYCATSSIFPQKKNPIALEAIKFAAGAAVNWLPTALATFRSEGSGDVTMREVPISDDALRQTSEMLRLFVGVLSTMTVNVGRMRELASANWSTATDIADLLVRNRGISFREAHHVVARLVRDALASNRKPSDVTPSMLAESAAQTLGYPLHVSESELRDALDPDHFAQTRRTEGGISVAEVRRMSGLAAQRVIYQRDWVEARKYEDVLSSEKLDSAVNSITGDRK